MFYVELIGIVASSVAGAMIAMDKKADLFGVLFLGIVTAFGGGILRDIMLGIIPHFFTSYLYIICSACAALAVFIDACVRRERYRREKEKIDSAVNIVDALAVAAYTVSGMNVAIGVNGMDNALLVIVLGITTGIGGGMIRDVLVNTMPFVLRKRVYAVASLGGALVYYFMLSFGIGELISASVSMAVTFSLRILATVFKWNLPHAEY